MTNDTTTLNGALTELGELMADNLNSMGVSDADASDGLTTLANKILDIAPVSQNLTLTSDKSILSAYDSEYATLTATLSGGVVEGQTVSFDIVSGGSVVENIGTATTNSSGVATVSYYAEGTGDINIQASVGMIVSETYVVEDCIFYDPCTSNAKASAWTIPSGITSTYSTDGWKVYGTGYKQVKLTDKLSSACSVELTIADYSDTRDMGIIIYAYTNGETTPNQRIMTGGSSVSTDWKVFDTILDHNMVKGGKYRIEYTSSTLKVYENDVLLGSATNNVGLPTRFEFHTSTNRWAIYKDVKVKPL